MTEPDKPFGFVRPAHFPEPTYSFENNPLTEKGFALGKKLFNDPRLSSDNSVACSNCHVKGVAFSDPQHRLSVGVEDRIGKRNTPGLANMAFRKDFFWDGGVAHLDFVPINALENPLEMNGKLAGVVHMLNSDPEYPALFKAAFPCIDSINAPLMLHAFSQYLAMLVSSDSPYDKYLTGEEGFNMLQLQGMALFEENCASCHSGVLFTNQGFRNNGLDVTFNDPGRAVISEGDHDIGKFMVPSLRNVELTAPYMHDGRFDTLEEVLEHYASKIQDSSTLAEELKKEGFPGIPITANEQAAIIEFLKTLTDRDFVSNPDL